MYVYVNDPPIRDKENMMKCIIQLFRSNIINIIYYMYLYIYELFFLVCLNMRARPIRAQEGLAYDGPQGCP